MHCHCILVSGQMGKDKYMNHSLNNYGITFVGSYNLLFTCGIHSVCFLKHSLIIT